ncbi:MAG: hypothetical protein QX190_15510 [Methylococcales bacterium]
MPRNTAVIYERCGSLMEKSGVEMWHIAARQYAAKNGIVCAN